MTRIYAILLLVLAARASCFGEFLEWPEFRGPNRQGISLATNLPVHWSASSNVVWKTPVTGGWSSPVISNGRIYITGGTNVGNEVSLRVICVDATSGNTIYEVEAMRAESAGAKHRKNGLASPTPIIHDRTIYAHFGHMGTAALDLSGKVLWKQTSIKYPPVHGNGASPALVADALIFSCDGAVDPFLVALDARTGQIRWKTPRNSRAKSQFSFSTPLAIHNNGADQVISPASGFVGAYDPRTGAEVWRVDYGEGYSVVPRPVFAHGLLFLSSGFDRPVIYAINPAGASGDVTAKAVAWSETKGSPNTPSLIVVGDELYAVSDAGIATCYDAKTGKIHWNERLGGGFSASPISAEGRLYFQNEEGVGYVVKAGKHFELLAKNELGDRTLASPAAIDNALLIRSADFLWRIGPTPSK